MPKSPAISPHSIIMPRVTKDSGVDDVKAAIFALTPQGAVLAERIACLRPADIFLSTSAMQALSPLGAPQNDKSLAPTASTPRVFEKFSESLGAAFSQYACLILICASGIAVRALAPLVQDKTTDPAVLLLDQRGQFVISLLSGHVGGANTLTRDLAKHLGATPVITTATDVAGLPAIDEIAIRNGLCICNIAAVKYISAALLRGEKPQMYDPDRYCPLSENETRYFEHCNALPDPGFDTDQSLPPIVTVGWQRLPVVNPARQQTSWHILRLAPPVLHVGIGCKRGTSADAILHFLQDTLHQFHMDEHAVASLGSITLKQNETGLLAAARHLALPLFFHEADTLHAVVTPNPSSQVFSVTGSASVAEAAALVQAGAGGKLIIPKQKGPGITCAVALAAHLEQTVD